MAEVQLETEKIDFANGKIGKLFRSVFFPTLAGMLAMTAATVIDGAFVGHGVGPDGMAAVNIVAPLWMVCTGLGLMFGMGSSVLASLHLAVGNKGSANLVLTQAFAAGFVLTLLMCGYCFLDPHGAVRMLGCSPRLEAYALDYMLWLLPGLVFLLWSCLGMTLVRLDGSPRYAMWMQVASAATNIVLDWVFVFPLGMGVKGAAVATAIACGVSGVMSLCYFVFLSETLKFCRLGMTAASVGLAASNLWKMMKIGAATFLAETSMSVMMFTGNYMFMGMLKEEGVAAFAVACYLFPVIFSANTAVAQSAQPIISYNYGAKQMVRVKQALGVSLKAAMCCGAGVMLLLWIGAPLLVGLFLKPGEAASDIALAGLPLLSWCALPFALNIAFVGYYQSVTKAGRSTVFMLLRGVVLSVPCFLLLPRVLDVAGLWLALPAAEVMTVLAIIVNYVADSRRRAV